MKPDYKNKIFWATYLVQTIYLVERTIKHEEVNVAKTFANVSF